MTSFVQLGESDTAFDLVFLLNRFEGHDNISMDIDVLSSSRIGALVVKGDYNTLINKEFFNSTALTAISALNEEEFDSAYSIMFSLLARLTAENDRNNAIQMTLKQLTNNAEKANIKIRLLVSLFNYVLGSGVNSVSVSDSVRFTVLSTLLTYAIANYSSANNNLLQSLPLLQNVFQQWQLSPLQFSELYSLFYQLSSAAKDTNASDEYLFKYLKHLDSVTDKQALENAKPLAFNAVLRSVGTPLQSNTTFVLESHRLFPLSTVTMLSTSTSDHQLAYQLLSLFVRPQIDAFQAWATKNAAFITANKFNTAMLLSKLRVLAIASLGVAHNTVTYTQLKTVLGLKEYAEVEDAVINAVVSGRVDAKLDEENETVIIKRVLASVGGVHSWVGVAGVDDDSETGSSTGPLSDSARTTLGWRFLSDKLQNWKLNVNNVINAINNNNAQIAQIQQNHDEDEV